MAALGAALPDVAYQNYTYPQQQRFAQGPAPTGMVYQFQPVPQLTIQAGLTPQGSALFNAQYQPQYQPVYAPSQLSSSPPSHPGTLPGSQYYQAGAYLAQQQASAPFFYQTNQYGAQPQNYASNPSSPQYAGQGTYVGDNRSLPHPRSHEYAGSSGRMPKNQNMYLHQLGHALWIGNLPPQTDLMSLVHHVCKETHGLESLFLISKSNCAFANFKDEATCAIAQTKIHDSRFQTVRLVSRLRRAFSGNASGASAAATSTSSTPVSGDSRVTSPGDPASRGTPAVTESLDGTAERSLPRDKFFVVKSLTVEDLELSVRNGIWATQSHNEEVLNRAYQTADNVYLIFSANKSGEYFGYARMASPINDDPAAAIEFTPKAPATAAPELPKAIPTPATEFVPKGRIIDDSARGTIFWEAERDEVDGGEDEDESRSLRSDPDAESPPKTWGKPFKVEWVSTTKLPFYRTRGLRNPWNSNREVKIARDGTELETSIGRRLLALFQHQPSPIIPTLSNMQGMMPIIPPGYPHMRQFP
ncbi:YT521-B-like domain-containing protein [Xylogone sp. PMI_703]|nr:YT521-B-like domain-containing protein [Xylogone sp. PMI_703]